MRELSNNQGFRETFGNVSEVEGEVDKVVSLTPREMCATPLARVAPRAAHIAAQRRLSDACLLVRCISVW